MDSKDETREQIIEAARHIFRRFGFKKTTMDEIALGVNKGKSSMYYYFTSKDQVFQAVVEKEALMLRAELMTVINADLAPSQKIEEYIKVRMTKFKEMVNFYDAIKNELLSHLDFIDQIRKKYDEDEICLVNSMLIDGVEKGDFSIENTNLASIAIVTAMKGLELPLFWYDGADNIDNRIKNVLQILFYGIKVR